MKNIQADPPIEEVFAKNFSEWIKNHPDRPTGFLSSLAKDLGVSLGQLSNILSRRRKTDEGWRRHVARKIGLPYETMIGLTPLPSLPSEYPLVVQVNSQTDKERLNGISDFYRGIPLYESGKLAAGVNGIEFDPYEEPVSTVIVYKPELQGCSKHRLAALRVGGDSMEPIIPKGSIVVVDLEDREHIEGKIYCVNITEGGIDIAAIKRIRIWEKGKGFVLISENHKYVPDLSYRDWPELCVGRVVWMWRDIRNI